jgi:predicted nucleic acid-binding Zn ribbon protein
MARVCQVCGQAFEAKRTDARFCSARCRGVEEEGG